MNSSSVNDYPIDAIHMGLVSGGDTGNPQFYVASGLRRNGIRAEIPIDIVQGEIVCRDPGTGATSPLRREDIEGSYFWLKSTRPLPDGSSAWQVWIRDVAPIPLWPDRGPTVEPVGFDYAWAYGFEVLPTGGQKFPLCPYRERWGEMVGKWRGPTKVQLPGRGAFDVREWYVEGHHAVLLAGETYDKNTATVALTGAAGDPWFNIACQGGALAKMKLMGYDPEDTRFPTKPAQRQATLKMITARYCPGRPDLSFTVNGQPLVWQNAARWFHLEDDYPVGETEALWNQDGAICLTSPRRVPIDEVACPGLPRCDESVGLRDDRSGWNIDSGAEWVTAQHE